jgi:hypothetical protein
VSFNAAQRLNPWAEMQVALCGQSIGARADEPQKFYGFQGEIFRELLTWA